MRHFTLFLNPRSPFARRIQLAMLRLEMTFEAKDLGNVFDPQLEFWKMNPLGMIPTLVTPEGEVFSDSSNLLEYLHELSEKIWPEQQAQRFRVRQAATWASGIMQSSILYYQEALMHQPPSEHFLKDHLLSIEDTLKFIASSDESLYVKNSELTQAGWDLCVALEYLDLRISQINWRAQYPKFEKLVKLANQNPLFVKTAPPQPVK